MSFRFFLNIIYLKKKIFIVHVMCFIVSNMFYCAQNVMCELLNLEVSAVPNGTLFILLIM